MAWFLVGSILGGLAGCVSAQVSFSGGLEHGSPGMGAGIAFILLLRMGLGALIGLFIGAAFGAMAK